MRHSGQLAACSCTRHLLWNTCGQPGSGVICSPGAKDSRQIAHLPYEEGEAVWPRKVALLNELAEADANVATAVVGLQMWLQMKRMEQA